MKMRNLVSIALVALCLTGCGARSQIDRRPYIAPKPPVIPAGIMEVPQGKTEIPRGAPLETQWSLWDQDRDRLDACIMLDAAKASTITTLTRPIEGTE